MKLWVAAKQGGLMCLFAQQDFPRKAVRKFETRLLPGMILTGLFPRPIFSRGSEAFLSKNNPWVCSQELRTYNVRVRYGL